MTEVTMSYRSSWMTEELEIFRDQFRKYLAKDLAPHAEKWREQKMVDRFAWRGLGEMGALLASVPEEYGGLGATFAYDAAVLDDLESTVPELTTGSSPYIAPSSRTTSSITDPRSRRSAGCRRWLPAR
ncbi:alkylation response protein AidB-like acyl-CoA dehydrogenase [Bradyrhizobium sp. LB9.1b]